MMNYDEALEIVKEANRLPPHRAEEYFHLGMAYAKLDCWQNAIAALEQALRIQPDYVDAYFSLGLIFHACKDVASAWKAYRNLKALDPIAAKQLLHRLIPDHNDETAA